VARIPQSFIDQLLARTDIVALIDARVPLKKSGREYTACCPFHDEKTPSFTISPAKQFYHCFGCGAHGSAISFLMDYDRLEFRDAVAVLAGQAGLNLPEEAQAAPAGPPREPLLAAMAHADRFYRRALRQSETAIAYLKRRGVSGDMAKTYGLGFADNAWDALARTVDDPTAAEQAGLIIARHNNDYNGCYFDRFRNRLMFPIRDPRGRTVAFGGRALGDDKAKYLNSPETPLFHKSDQVYGLYEARQALRDLPRLIVVEGYMDVIALAQHGFANAVATLGTATTASHLSSLFRHTQEIVFCFDGDAAGMRAAHKALKACLPVMRGTRRVRFLFLPAGEDPDTWVRGDNGGAVFAQAIERARPASAVLIDSLTEGIDLTAPDGRAQLIESARPYVSALPPEAFRTELIAEIADLARLPAADLRGMFAASAVDRPAASQNPPARATRVTPVARALRLLLHDPGLAARVTQTSTLREARAPGAAILAEAIEFFANNPTIAISHWLERYRDESYFDRLQQLAAMTPPGGAETRATEFFEAIRRLTAESSAQQRLRERYDELVARQSHRPLDTESAQELKDVFQQLQQGRDDPA
jgi:DNA primase